MCKKAVDWFKKILMTINNSKTIHKNFGIALKISDSYRGFSIIGIQIEPITFKTHSTCIFVKNCTTLPGKS